MKIAILIIAAGASRRLGQPKQLLPYNNTFLLNHVIQICESSDVGDIFVILGANREGIQERLSADIPIFYNEKWKEGMGTSIAIGIQNIIGKGYDGAIISVGDQPFFTKELLTTIVKTRQTSNAPIVVSKYKKGMGPPVFFEQSLFVELSKLEGDIGAKPVIKKYFDNIAMIDFEKGHIDIDTPDDLKYLK